uniref:Uncharacterized protein n=1 Tax=Oryza glumipatula TaxID=40148 RepID=A0A0E0AUL8_9ORYZ
MATPSVPRRTVLQPPLRLSGITRHLILLEAICDACLCGAHNGGWVTVAVDPWQRFAAVNVFTSVRVIQMTPE